jgi:hypothetical protein
MPVVITSLRGKSPPQLDRDYVRILDDSRDILAELLKADARFLTAGGA